MFKRKVKLPETHVEFDCLVDVLCRKYRLNDKHHAAALLSIAIRHIPNEQFYTTYSYLGDYIRKNIANTVAWHKGEVLKHEGQVRQLESILQTDPNNCQAMDELKKAANEGSIYAAAALKRLFPAPEGGSALDRDVHLKDGAIVDAPMRAELEADAEDASGIDQ